jgi:acetyl esterase/lipase
MTPDLSGFAKILAYKGREVTIMYRSYVSVLSRITKTLGIAFMVLAILAAKAPTASAAEKYSIDPISGTKYKADDDMRALLTALSALGGKPIETLTPAEARAQPTMTDAVNALLKKRGQETGVTNVPDVPGVTKPARDVTTVDSIIPGPKGTELHAILYTPTGPGPFPAIVFLHGGGWVIGSPESYDAGARGLAKGVQAVVISVNYRLAPENRFPAAFDDALAAYRWAASTIGRWRGDPRRLALAGEGAGGTIALATAISSAEAGLTRPKAVIAVYPLTQTGSATESYVDSANARPLNKAMIAWFLRNTLSTESDKTDPRLDLIHAKLSLLPSVTIINAQIDPLRSDGTMLEEALRQANVPVTRREYEGVTHDFFEAAAVLPEAKKAQSFAVDQLKEAFKE